MPFNRRPVLTVCSSTDPLLASWAKFTDAAAQIWPPGQSLTPMIWHLAKRRFLSLEEKNEKLKKKKTNPAELQNKAAFPPPPAWQPGGAADVCVSLITTTERRRAAASLSAPQQVFVGVKSISRCLIIPSITLFCYLQ